MLDCIKYDLLKIQRDLWLKNLVKLFKPISKFCYEQFRKNAINEDKSDLTEFCTVARKLHEKFEQQKNEQTVRDAAFPAIYREEDEQVSETDQKPGKKERKRSESQSKLKNSKRSAIECSGCEIRGHNL